MMRIILIIIHDIIPIVVNVVDGHMMRVPAPNNKMMGKRFLKYLKFFETLNVNLKSAATDDQQQNENKGSARQERRRSNRR
jgi:hypothetical protein